MHSAMGILNLRLLAPLQQQQSAETLPVQLQPDGQTPGGNTDSLLETAPSIPWSNVTMDICETQRDLHSTTAEVQEMIRSSQVTIQVPDQEDGMGLVISQKGYILTHAHLLQNAERIYVTLSNGTRYRAALVGSDAYTDLAVLYIRASNLIPAQFCGEPDFKGGEKVTALCRDHFSGGTIFISTAPLQIADIKLPLFKTTASTGQDAAFLFNNQGQAIGIISPRISQYVEPDSEDLAYVLPTLAVKHIVDQILQHGFVSGRPGICAQVEEVTDLYQSYWQLPDGLRITSSTCSQLQQGDILICINGKNISTKEDLYDVLRNCQLGQEVEAQIYRNKKTQTITIFINEEQP
jgi:serine protease Do